MAMGAFAPTVSRRLPGCRVTVTTVVQVAILPPSQTGKERLADLARGYLATTLRLAHGRPAAPSPSLHFSLAGSGDRSPAPPVVRHSS